MDQLPASTRDGKENYSIAASSISLIFGLLLTAGNAVDFLRNMIVGNVVENGEFVHGCMCLDERREVVVIILPTFVSCTLCACLERERVCVRERE